LPEPVTSWRLVALVCLALGGWPWPVVLLAAIVAAAAFGGAWAFLPGYLQAKRGSHTVITTIMFNFLAAILLNYLLVEVLIAPNQQSPQTVRFDPSTFLPYAHDLMNALGLKMGRSPLNLSFLWALACCGGLFQVTFAVFVYVPTAPAGIGAVALITTGSAPSVTCWFTLSAVSVTVHDRSGVLDELWLVRVIV